MRAGMMRAISELAKKDPNVMLLTGDVGFGLLEDFQEKYPLQHINTGIAEQNMIGVATGLSLEGGKVFVYSRDKSQQGCIVLTEFQAHDDYLLKCVISPDCSQLATTSADKTVKLWDTTTWKLKQRIKAHQKWVIIVTATFIEIYCFLFYPILSFLLCLFHSSLSKFCVGLGYCIFC